LYRLLGFVQGTPSALCIIYWLLDCMSVLKSETCQSWYVIKFCLRKVLAHYGQCQKQTAVVIIIPVTFMNAYNLHISMSLWNYHEASCEPPVRRGTLTSESQRLF